MIPQRYIDEWKSVAPWPIDAQVEQDLIIVQIFSEPISPILKRIRERLSFLGTKRTVKQHIHNNTIIYRFEPEDISVTNMRLKIEINTREHFNVLGLKEIPYQVTNGWFSGECFITSYEIEELLGTKLRALYQRGKGRDLFDLYWALTNYNVDIDKLIECYNAYMEFSVDKPPTRKQFMTNMEEKMQDEEFLSDIHSILKPEVEYQNEKAWKTLKKLLESI
ncbi:MAG: nucleotidyl transferase AbiEii/AbiGii toxin family protein [Fermentimonas sp.]|jgi:predicted nucleotidyltransferase component of viral defense system